MREGEPTSWRKREVANDDESPRIIGESEPTPTPDPESAVESAPQVPNEAIETRHKEDLNAVRQRLGLSVDSETPKAIDKPESGPPLPAEDLWSDPAYLEFRKEKHEGDRDKSYDLVDYEAEQEFRRSSPDAYTEYQAREAKRIYRDFSGKPSLQDDRFFKRMFLPRTSGGMGYNSNNVLDEMSALRTIVSLYPDKAAVYAETDDKLKRILESENL